MLVSALLLNPALALNDITMICSHSYEDRVTFLRQETKSAPIRVITSSVGSFDLSTEDCQLLFELSRSDHIDNSWSSNNKRLNIDKSAIILSDEWDSIQISVCLNLWEEHSSQRLALADLIELALNNNPASAIRPTMMQRVTSDQIIASHNILLAQARGSLSALVDFRRCQLQEEIQIAEAERQRELDTIDDDLAMLGLVDTGAW